MELVLPDGTRIPFYKAKPKTVGGRTVEHIVNNNVTRIDHGEDGDQTHVYLQGNLGADEFFIRCVNPLVGSQDVFRVGYNGEIRCGDITSDTISTLQLYSNSVQSDFCRISQRDEHGSK